MTCCIDLGSVELQLWFIYSAAVSSPKNGRFLLLLLLGSLLCLTHAFDNGQVNIPELLWNMYAISNMASVVLFAILVCWLCYVI